MMFGNSVSQARAEAQSYLDQARLQKTEQDFKAALVLYNQAKVAFKNIASTCQVTPLPLSQLKSAFSKAQTSQAAEEEALRQRIAEVYFERAELLETRNPGKAQASYKKAQAWGYEEMHPASIPSAVLLSASGLPPVAQITTSTQQKSALVDYLFKKALSTLRSLEVSNKPSLFLIYAHDSSAYRQAEADTSKYLINKLSKILGVILYSDQTPMAQPYTGLPQKRKNDSKLEDILTSQLSLLPDPLQDDVKPVDKVVVCCSELLGSYLGWSHYKKFYQQIQKAYFKDREAYRKNGAHVGTPAIRQVVRQFSQEEAYKAEFHHVLTEIAFLQIRAEQLKDKHGIIPISLTPNCYQKYLKEFIETTTVRLEDIPRFEAQAKAGREVYPNQGRHVVLFKLIERLIVGSDEAQMFLDKFWEGYNECISRLKNESMLDAADFAELVDRIFGKIEAEQHRKLAATVQQVQEQLKHQQEIALQSKREPLAILGKNIEAEYFTVWEEQGEIQDGLAMYVAPQATTVTDTNTTFDLHKAVTAFLTPQENAGQKTRVLLLRGEAGSGKSTFNRQLARRLWREYSAAPASEGRPIPLYIALPTIDRPNKNLIGQYLSDKCGFSPEQIDALRESQRFILILDGYDEIPAEQRNLYADEKLDQWQAKIILSCRPEYLTEGYKNYLQPRGCSRLLLEYQLAPFSELLIDTYIDQYVKHTQAKWSAQQYKDTLARMPNINALLGTPFLLKMALSVLPTLDKVQFDQVGLTRIQLYEQFVQTWFERSLARLKVIQSKLTDAQQKAFRSLEDEFIEHSQVFNTDFALAMSEAKTTVAEYSAIARRGMLRDTRYEPFLSNKDEEKNLLRCSALLIRQYQQYRFIHKSIQDYLVARAVWEELENASERNASHGAEPLNEIKDVRKLWEELAPPIQVDPAALLNRFNVVEELAVQRFLVERVQQNQALVKLLLMWIKASTDQNTVSTASANAMTILVRAGVQFNGMDLQRIRIPGADLSFGVFDSAQLQGADLSNVNLCNSWLREADLSGTQMAEVQFGECPYLKEACGVLSCAYSPDGKTCAIGLEDGEISIYDTSTWEKINTLQEHTGSVTSVMYSPSGQQIASGSKDKTVKLWNVQTGALECTLRGHKGSVLSVVYSPSGEQIASVGLDKMVRLWNAQTGKSSHILEGHSSISSVAYSPNGEQIASGGDDKMVRLWNAQTGANENTLIGHDDSVRSVAFSPNGKQIASGDDDRKVWLWNAQTGAHEDTLVGHDDSVRSVAFSPSGEQIASGSDDRTVRLWNTQTGAHEHTLQGHSGRILSVVYSPNGEQIASSSDDTTVRLWNAKTNAHRPTLRGHAESVLSVVYSPSGEQIASSSRDKTVLLWNAQTGAPGHTLQGHTGPVRSVAYSPDGKQIASSDDTAVRLWNAQTGAPGHTLEGHKDWVRNVVYSPSGEQIASGSDDRTVRLWNAQTGAHKHTLEGHIGRVWSVVYSPDGEQIASGDDETVRLWDAQTGNPGPTLNWHDGWVRRAQLLDELLDAQTENPGPTLNLHDGWVRGTRLWGEQTGKRMQEYKSSFLSVVYSPGGEQIATTGSNDKMVQLWNAQTGALERSLGHEGSVLSVAYSPSGEQIASGSEDNRVRLWETKTGKCLAVVPGLGEAIRSIAWKTTPDGIFLAIGCDDKSVRQWKIIEEEGHYQVRLCWSSMHDRLIVSNISIQNAQGLSQVNTKLLKQRGEVGEPLFR